MGLLPVAIDGLGHRRKMPPPSITPFSPRPSGRSRSPARQEGIAMTHFGKINSYNSANGTGTIAPEQGGDMLPFRKADLRQQSPEPQAEQRYGYETQSGDGGKKWAVGLELQPA